MPPVSPLTPQLCTPLRRPAVRFPSAYPRLRVSTSRLDANETVNSSVNNALNEVRSPGGLQNQQSRAARPPLFIETVAPAIVGVKDQPSRSTNENSHHVTLGSLRDHAAHAMGAFVGSHFFKLGHHKEDSPAKEHQMRAGDEDDDDLEEEEEKLWGRSKVDMPMTMIVPGIFLGSVKDADNVELMRANDIKFVLSFMRDIDYENTRRPKYDKHVKVQCVPVADSSTQAESIDQYFDEVFKFIDEAVASKSGILVHCQRGMSRSPTFLMAYLMHRRHLSFDEALGLVKRQRPVVDPNLGFRETLEFWDQKWSMERKLRRQRITKFVVSVVAGCILLATRF